MNKGPEDFLFKSIVIPNFYVEYEKKTLPKEDINDKLFNTYPRVSHQNKMFEGTLPDLTTFVLGWNKLKFFFSDFFDPVLIPPQPKNVHLYIKKIILEYRVVQ